jgi:hypothetical protein
MGMQLYDALVVDLEETPLMTKMDTEQRPDDHRLLCSVYCPFSGS